MKKVARDISHHKALSAIAGIKNKPIRRVAKGFSFVELTISVSLISLLVVAVGLAVHHAKSRADESRSTFTRRHITNEVVRNLTRRLRWANEITLLTGSEIIYAAIAPDSGQTETATLRWDSETYTLLASPEESPDIVIAQDIRDFGISAEIFTNDSEVRISELNITFRIGQESNSPATVTVELVNTPIWNTGVPEP